MWLKFQFLQSNDGMVFDPSLWSNSNLLHKILLCSALGWAPLGGQEGQVEVGEVEARGVLTQRARHIGSLGYLVMNLVIH